jgi:hypothetical protein
MLGGGLAWWESWCKLVGLVVQVLVGYYDRADGVVADERCFVAVVQGLPWWPFVPRS